ncbi:hypothetical protein HU200_004716 [Digitaria exilis]|uniref:VWFA domain-containing protein n=1 Tax=Digitaria exilis TaxID=1010633 RepID=A0A835FUG1_9POAL|nr:hypothetical protein HU200_004716 [Digitaria exilis]
MPDVDLPLTSSTTLPYTPLPPSDPPSSGSSSALATSSSTSTVDRRVTLEPPLQPGTETRGEWRRHVSVTGDGQQGTPRWVVEVAGASTDERPRRMRLGRWRTDAGEGGVRMGGGGGQVWQGREGGRLRGLALLHFHATEEGNLNRVPVVDGYCTSRRFHATSSPYNYAPKQREACRGGIGLWQAAFTSECAHTFHLRCVSGSAACPPRAGHGPRTGAVERPLDDQDNTNQEAASNNGVLVLKTHCEHPAVARDTALDNFAVLVHIKAPATATAAERTESERAPLDLVTVLDVSGSMEGPKLTLLKQAMGFVIDHLGSGDRLSIVTFSSRARRIIRLSRMTDGGKALAKAAVESIFARGFTNIGDGLRVAAEVLDGRRHKNAVASVILLSDGHDNHTLGSLFSGKSYDDLVPLTLRRSNDNRCPPVHTFGFGTDHDVAAMHAIAENHAVVQDSFAQCFGGLLSVAVQEAHVAVECLHPGSGRYDSHVDADGRAASVDAGELYADEERRFLLFLDVPVAAGEDATPLIKVRVTYKDAVTGRSVDVTCEDAMVQRPVVVADTEPCVEVARELFRVEAAEDIAAAKAAADRGEHTKAAQILDRRREASAANAGLAGDERCAELVAELRELSARVADRREYEHTGRACMLAGMSSHAQQRAATVHLFQSAAAAPSAFGSMTSASSPGQVRDHRSGVSANTRCHFPIARPCNHRPVSRAAPSFGNMFATPTMQSMVASSRKAREQQQTEQGGSLFGLK